MVLAAGTTAQAAFSALLIGLPVLAPALRDRYDLSLSQVGLALSTVWIGPILTLLPWGLLADRIGERLVLASGLAGCGVLAAAAGWAGSFEQLVVLLTVAGAMGASVNAASGRAVMQWFSVSQRGLALGVRQTAIPLGGALAALALPVVNHAGGLKASFVFLGAVCVVAAVIAVVAVREATRPEIELEAEDVEWTLRDTRLWLLSFGSGLYLFAQIALTSFFVLFLHDVHGVSAGAAAGALAVMQVGAVITRISAGRISDALQRADQAAALDRARELRRRFAHGGADERPGRGRRAGDDRRGRDLDGLERPLRDGGRRARGAAPQRSGDRLSADDAVGDRRDRPGRVRLRGGHDVVGGRVRARLDRAVRRLVPARPPAGAFSQLDEARG